MQTWITLMRRELGGYFTSFTGYTVLAVVLLLIGVSFVGIIELINGQPTPLPITEIFYQTPFFWLILLLVSPVITMRSFAMEKDSGTFEALMTAPVSDAQVVAAKFFGAMAFYIITWLPLLACVMVFRHFAEATEPFDYGILASTAIGIGLLGCLFISAGIFASSLTRSQVTAAMLSFAFGATLFMMSFLGGALPSYEGSMSLVIAIVNLRNHMENFAAGILDSRALVFCLSLTALFLFLTMRVVESRRWK